MSPAHPRLQRLQEEVIDIQIRIRDLDQQRTELRKKLNGRLSTLLSCRKLLQVVKPINSFQNGATKP